MDGLEKCKLGMQKFAEYYNSGNVEVNIIGCDIRTSFGEKSGNVIGVPYQYEELVIRDVMGYDIKFVQKWDTGEYIFGYAGYPTAPVNYTDVHYALGYDEAEALVDICKWIESGISTGSINQKLIRKFSKIKIEPTVPEKPLVKVFRRRGK